MVISIAPSTHRHRPGRAQSLHQRAPACAADSREVFRKSAGGRAGLQKGTRERNRSPANQGAVIDERRITVDEPACRVACADALSISNVDRPERLSPAWPLSRACAGA
jgi:hypothetical protein